VTAEISRQPYTLVEAVNEAKRCLQCTEPYCNEGCPAQIDVRAFLNAVATGNFTAAARTLQEHNVLPLACAFICPVERQCEHKCRNSGLCAPIAVDRIQRFVAEQDIERGLYQPSISPSNGHRVAPVGAGPAGLSAAAELTQRGYTVVVFEKRSKPGGMLSGPIPSYRLPADAVERELAHLAKRGFQVEVGKRVESFDELFADGFEAVFLATGLWRSARLRIPGEELEGVHGALEFLEALAAGSSPKVGPRVLVIGGGSVAMDAACSAFRAGAKNVEIACLESPAEMPATREEIGRAWEEGVIFHNRVKPVRILGENGRVCGFEGVRIEWKEPGCYLPSNAKEIEGTEFRLWADTVLVAIGQTMDESAQALVRGLRMERGRVVVDGETWMTSRDGVFAGGDLALGGGATVAKSVCEGKRVGAAIDAYLQRRA